VRLALTRDQFTWVMYGQLAIFGYFLYGFGPVVPLLRDEQSTSRAIASLHGTALAVGGMLGGLVFSWLVRRYGRATVMWLGQTGIVLGVAGLSVAHAPAATIGSVLIAGTAGTFVINSVTAALADHHGAAGPAAISEANAAAAGIGTISPLIVGASTALGLGWRPGLAAAALLSGVLALVTFGLRVRVPRSAASATGERAPGRPLPTQYWLAWGSLFFTGSVEVSFSLWAADVLRDHAGASAGTATAAVSGIVAGMFVGRLVGVRLLLRHAAPPVLLCALAISTAGLTVFWVATVPWLAIAALVVCGLGNSVHYPLAMGLAVQHSDGQPDRAAGRTAYAVGLSFGVAPFVLGWVADRIGPHPAFLIVFVMLAGSAVVVSRLWRLGNDAGHRDTVGDGQQDGLDPRIGDDRPVELDHRPVVGVLRREDPPVA
jgi:fucose permease